MRRHVRGHRDTVDRESAGTTADIKKTAEVYVNPGRHFFVQPINPPTPDTPSDSRMTSREYVPLDLVRPCTATDTCDLLRPEIDPVCLVIEEAVDAAGSVA